MTNQPYCLGASKAKAKEKEEVVGSAECAIHPKSPYQTVTKYRVNVFSPQLVLNISTRDTPASTNIFAL
jgi:hypothetical protein